MDAEVKKRKTAVRKRHVKPTETARPEEVWFVLFDKQSFYWIRNSQVLIFVMN